MEMVLVKVIMLAGAWPEFWCFSILHIEMFLILQTHTAGFVGGHMSDQGTFKAVD